MKQPAARARASKRMLTHWRDPAWRAKARYRSLSQHQEIIRRAATGEAFVEIAIDYDCTISNICHIARKAGLSRQRPRRLGAA